MANTTIDPPTTGSTFTTNTLSQEKITDRKMCRTQNNEDLAKSERIVQLQEENTLLKTQLAEAIKSNKKWLSYDHKRDELVNTLLAKNKELQLKLTHTGVVGEGCDGGADCPHAIHWRKRAQEEEALRIHLEAVTHRQQVFLQQLERARQTRPEDAERIALLENQVQVFSEDFEQERRDRERAQSRIGKLEEELALARQQLDQFQESHMAFLAQRRQATMSAYMDEYQRQAALQHARDSAYPTSPRLSPPTTNRRSRLIAHGLPSESLALDGDDDEEDTEDTEDIPLSCRWGKPSYKQQTSHKSTPPQAETLECPKCHKLFPVDDPLAFLEHNDECDS